MLASNCQMDGVEAVTGRGQQSTGTSGSAASREERAVLAIMSLMDRVRLWDRWPLLFRSIHIRLSALYGVHRAAEQTRHFSATVLLHLIIMALLTGAASVPAGSPMLLAGALFMLLYAFYRFRNLETLVRNRKRAIVLELPELINKLILLMNAGETVHQAIHRCVPVQAALPEAGDQPLAQAWRTLSRALKDNKPFVWAMEEFSRSCGVLEVSMFSTAVLLNFKRGGPDFVTALQDLSHTLWERRKATARTIGEEAAAKLVIPMVLLFCTVMVIVAAPAVLMMNG